MTYVVTGSPVEPFADAVLTALGEDQGLIDLVGDRIVASLARTTKTALPYIVGGRRGVYPSEHAVMQVDGGKLELWLDFWSEQNGPHEVQQMQARARAVLLRRALHVPGYVLMGGSLVCDDDRVFQDFDPDMPNKSLFHGVQHWTADAEVA